jgi:S1-C subfamily serine protease
MRRSLDFSGRLAILASLVLGWILAPTLAEAGVATPAGAKDKDEAVRESVVKIYSTIRPPDPFRPWQKGGQQEATGTGVVIDGKRILTNAHVVSYATQVSVEPSGSGEKLAASVLFSAPGIDLALLKLEDESFFEKRVPLPRAENLPEIKESVTVYGYPTGGSSLSITKGIVSRIEFVPYGDRTEALRIQIDAAVNPGNSGGPALVEDKMIGLVNSGIRGADNIGYIIPAEEVEIFLKDVSDGNYDGKPTLRVGLQTLENEALRAKLGFSKRAVGMVVHDSDTLKEDGNPLRPWDVLLKVGDHEIDNVGKVKVRDDLRLRFQYYIQSLAQSQPAEKSGKVPMTIVRDGKEELVQVPVTNKHDELITSLRGKYPSYFIYGPLVFSPATAEFIGATGGNQLVYPLIASPLALRRTDKTAFPGEELVVVSTPMFAHKIGKGYDNPWTKVVKEINGVRIKNLRHLVETLRDASDKYVTLSFDDKASETMVFDRAEVLKATDDILSDNGIRQQASDDVAPIWTKKP